MALSPSYENHRPVKRGEKLWEYSFKLTAHADSHDDERYDDVFSDSWIHTVDFNPSPGPSHLATSTHGPWRRERERTPPLRL